MLSAKEVGWAHAANDERGLLAALTDDQLSMIEADIMFLRGEDEGKGVPVMAHPPTIPPDALPFEVWLDRILDHNRRVADPSKKGVKLDFKSPEVVGPCLAVLAARGADRTLDFPIWLNADILPGPGGPPSEFDGPTFVEACQMVVPGAVLSLGWTTGYPSNAAAMAGYTAAMVDAMLALIEDHVREGTHVTFPLQLWYAHRAWPQVERLLARQLHAEGGGGDQQPRKALVCSITLWGEEDEGIRRWVEASTPYLEGRVYVDLVPAKLLSSVFFKLLNYFYR